MRTNMAAGRACKPKAIHNRDILFDLLVSAQRRRLCDSTVPLTLFSIRLEQFGVEFHRAVLPQTFQLLIHRRDFDNRAISRPGRTGIVTCGTCSLRIS